MLETEEFIPAIEATESLVRISSDADALIGAISAAVGVGLSAVTKFKLTGGVSGCENVEQCAAAGCEGAES